jgi:Flp pilus assembly protein TadD
MVERLKKVIKINPEHADALNYLGYSYAEKGIHLDEAYSLVKKALALKPDNGYIMDSLGWVYFKSGKYEEALKVLLKAAETVKNDPVVLEHLGDVYDKLGQKEKARVSWGKSIEFQQKSEDEDLKARVEKKIKDLR